MLNLCILTILFISLGILSVTAPTRYPTVSSPTIYPTGKMQVETLYPTALPPTRYPTGRAP
jgi:hypothetical protein